MAVDMQGFVVGREDNGVSARCEGRGRGVLRCVSNMRLFPVCERRYGGWCCDEDVRGRWRSQTFRLAGQFRNARTCEGARVRVDNPERVVPARGKHAGTFRRRRERRDIIAGPFTVERGCSTRGYVPGSHATFCTACPDTGRGLHGQRGGRDVPLVTRHDLRRRGAARV